MGILGLATGIGAGTAIIAANHASPAAPAPSAGPEPSPATYVAAPPASTAADAETTRLADEAAAVDRSTQLSAAITNLPNTLPANPPQGMMQASLEPRGVLPGSLNDTLRGMVQRTGKRCNAITDHVWVTAEHISIMCDRRLRAAFIHEGEGWRLARPGE